MKLPVIIPTLNLSTNSLDIEIYQIENDINSLFITTPNQELTPEEFEKYEKLVRDKYNHVLWMNGIQESNRKDTTELKGIIDYEKIKNDDVDDLISMYQNNMIPHLDDKISEKEKYVKSLDTELEFFENPNEFRAKKDTLIEDYKNGMFRGKELKCLTKKEEDECEAELEAKKKEDITLDDIKIDNEIGNRLQRRREKFFGHKRYIREDINEEIQNEQVVVNELRGKRSNLKRIIYLFHSIRDRNRDYGIYKTELDVINKQLVEISTTKTIGGYYGQNDSNEVG